MFNICVCSVIHINGMCGMWPGLASMDTSSKTVGAGLGKHLPKGSDRVCALLFLALLSGLEKARLIWEYSFTLHSDLKYNTVF